MKRARKQDLTIYFTIYPKFRSQTRLTTLTIFAKYDKKHWSIKQTTSLKVSPFIQLFFLSFSTVFWPLYLTIICVSGESLAVKPTGPPMRMRDKVGERHRGTYLILHFEHTNNPPAASHCPAATDVTWSAAWDCCIYVTSPSEPNQ